MRPQVPRQEDGVPDEGKRFWQKLPFGSWRYEKGGPEGPPLLCGIIPAG